MLVFLGDDYYPLEVSVLETTDEVGDEMKDGSARKRDSDNDGDGDKKDESYVVNLHGLPYSATMEDVTEFLEGLSRQKKLCFYCIFIYR